MSKNSTDGKNGTDGTDGTEEVQPVSSLGYEAAHEELVDVVRRLEQGGFSLEESLRLWERGEELSKRCEQHLAGARARIEEVLDTAGDGGEGTAD